MNTEYYNNTGHYLCPDTSSFVLQGSPSWNTTYLNFAVKLTEEALTEYKNGNKTIKKDIEEKIEKI